MINNYLLEELVTFSETKTLAKTAEKLMVTQPTITRGMQKLEEELNVKLFDRQPNKIVLTKTGELAAKKAKELLAANQEFITSIQNYDQSQQVITIGSVAPGPLVIADLLPDKYGLEINPDFLQPAKVVSAIETNQFSLCFTNQEVQTSTVESLYLGNEQLYVNLDQFMFLAGQQEVSFKELKGLSFVVLSDIGPWKEIIQEQIPDAKFLYQAQRDALTEITRYSNFPYFSTNVTKLGSQFDDLNNADRVTLPITDQMATMPFYATYLKSKRQELKPVLHELIKLWPKAEK